MATAKRRRGAAATDDVELASLPALDEKSPTEERRELELEDILSEIGSDGRIKVWQIIEGRAAYAGDMSVDGFSLDVLLDTYGGGEKSLVVYQGKTKKETIRVSLDPSIPARNPRTPKALAGQAAPSAPGVSDLAAVMAANAQSQGQMMQTTMQMMTGMMTAVTAMMTARPEKDPMETALKMAEVMGGKDRQGGTATEMFEIFERGMNIGKAVTAKDEGDGVMEVVGEGMKTLGVLVNGIVESKKAEAAGRRALPAQGGSGAAANTTDGPSGGIPHGASEDRTHVEGGATTDDTSAVVGRIPVTSVRPWVDAARPHMGMLLQAARFMPATAAAETISKNLPDEAFFDLIDDIRDQAEPGFGPRLLQYFPAASKVPAEWIGELVMVLLTDYVEDSEDVEDAPVSPAPTDNGG